jgi:hypothetical protein
VSYSTTLSGQERPSGEGSEKDEEEEFSDVEEDIAVTRIEPEVALVAEGSAGGHPK